MELQMSFIGFFQAKYLNAKEFCGGRNNLDLRITHIGLKIKIVQNYHRKLAFLNA